VQKVETGIPNLLPPEFFSLKENVLGDRTTFITFYGQRKTARRGEYGAQSRPRSQQQIGTEDITLLHFPEHIKIRQELWLRLRQPNDLMAQTMAQEEIARAGADFRTLFDNTRVATIATGLATGIISFDGQGNLIPTGSATPVAASINWGVPAINQNQLGGIIDSPWSNPNADIVQQVENLKIQMRLNTGRELENAFYGASVPNYLWINNIIGKFWQFNPPLLAQFRANPQTIPDGTLGIKRWHRMSEMFFDSIASQDTPASSEVSNLIWPVSQVTFTPAIDRNTYTLYEGSVAAPKSFQIGATLEAAMANFELVYGFGGYAIPEYDPVGAKLVFFDTMGPFYKTAFTTSGNGAGDLFQAIVAF
jgi:hypothetical protein